ncbi:MAG: polysaccharide deacetylase family protein [Solirubrobacteraceae bacterium]
MPQELILTFHGLGEPPQEIAEAERKVWVPVEWFQAIVDTLPRRAVGLAFDDGNGSDVEHALPILARRGLTARFFPLVGRIGTVGYLNAANIVELSAAGMGIGSHGCHHRDWRTLDDGELHEELTLSRRTLAGIVGSEIFETACPFGSYDRRVLRALRTAGYRRVFTSDGGSGPAGAWLSARTTVHRDRPLEHWLDLARAGAPRRPDPVLLGKRLVKRLR